MLSLLPVAIIAIQRSSSRAKWSLGDKQKKAVYSRESVCDLEEAVTGHLASTFLPASIVEEPTKLRTGTSH